MMKIAAVFMERAITDQAALVCVGEVLVWRDSPGTCVTRRPRRATQTDCCSIVTSTHTVIRQDWLLRVYVRMDMRVTVTPVLPSTPV